MIEQEKQGLRNELRQFNGSDNWYQHWANHLVTYTDGALYLAEKAGAYWLLDEIAIRNKHVKAVQQEEFQLWKLKRTGRGNTAVLTCDDGNGNIVHTYHIKFTDFPLDEITLYFENNVIYLPSER